MLDDNIESNPQVIMRYLDKGDGFGGKGEKKDNIFTFLHKK